MLGEPPAQARFPPMLSESPSRASENSMSNFPKWLSLDEWKRKHRIPDNPRPIKTPAKRDRADYGSSFRTVHPEPILSSAKDAGTNPAESLGTAGGARTSLPSSYETRTPGE